MSAGPDDADGRDEAFIARWSRRKAQPEDGAESAEVAPDPVEAEPTPEEREKLIAALPPLDSIGPGVDLKPFLAKWVPEDLRNAALRRMWSTDPAIRDAVGDALDYAHDYNAPETIAGWGPLSPGDSVQETVERLFAGQPPRMREEEAPEEAPSTPEEPAVAAARPLVDHPEAVPMSEVKKPSQEADKGNEISRRRHGGALPS